MDKSEMMGNVNGALSQLKAAASTAENLWEDGSTMLPPHTAYALVEAMREVRAITARISIVAKKFEEVARSRDAVAKKDHGIKAGTPA